MPLPTVKRVEVESVRQPPVTSGEQGVQFHERTKRRVEFGGQAYEIRRLTPEERRAFRRRLNLWIFGVSAVLLSLTVAALLLWRG